MHDASINSSNRGEVKCFGTSTKVQNPRRDSLWMRVDEFTVVWDLPCALLKHGDCDMHGNQDRSPRPVPLTSENDTSTLCRWWCCTLEWSRASKEEATISYVFFGLYVLLYVDVAQAPRTGVAEEVRRWLWRVLELQYDNDDGVFYRYQPVLPEERAEPNGKITRLERHSWTHSNNRTIRQKKKKKPDRFE